MVKKSNKSMSTAITITTINKPIVIESYIKNVKRFEHKNVQIIVVGDNKTPSGVREYCQNLTKKYGIIIQYFDINFQKDYLKRFPELDKYLPYDSFSRRNVGDLFSYENGFDLIVRVDDDNYPTDEDFISLHSTVGSNHFKKIINSSNGWYNVCEELIDADSIPFYPRGYPYSKRWSTGEISISTKKVKVVLNAGLWLGDPDVDAITRLSKPINAIKYKRTYGDTFALDKGTWCPINTQNTVYTRDIIPASFVPPNVGRYDDIWSGYFLRKITDHFDHYVTYGSPLLFQKRNVHNLWVDLENEINGNIYTDHLIDTMNSFQLSETSYTNCYYELASKLDANLSENRAVFDPVIKGMKIWYESINSIP